ncbi:MAG: hypothetical protein AAGA22_00030 [Pseudomonadota bacterium]
MALKDIRPLKAANASERPQLRCFRTEARLHEFIEAGDLVITDAAENPEQPGLRIDVLSLTISMRVKAIAMALPPPSEPAKIQFLRR